MKNIEHYLKPGAIVPVDIETTKALVDALKEAREALAGAEGERQPEQEPVAWMRHDGARVTTAADRKNYPDYETRYSVPLYTTPPKRTWVGLTDEEVKHQWEVWRANAPRYVGFAKGIEAKLKEKNT